MTLLKITDSTPPVTLEDAKTFFRIIGDEENELIESLLEVATAKAEQKTNRSLYLTEFELYLDNFSKTKLPRPPFKEVLGVSYLANDGSRKDYSDYLTTNGEYPVITFGQTPSDYKSGVESVKVHYKAGYTELPAPIRQWILVYALTLYENRENITVNASVDTNIAKYYDHLLDSYKVYTCE